VKTGQPIEVGRKEVMSKSKKNVVPPARIIETFGADTARWFVLSDSPPERDMEWTDAGVEGAWRFTQRLWRIAESWTEAHAALKEELGVAPNSFPPEALAFAPRHPQDHRRRHRGHREIPLSTAASPGSTSSPTPLGEVKPEGSKCRRSLGPQGGAGHAGHAGRPMLPHLAEEIWQNLGHKTLLVETPWPAADAALTIDDMATVAVQVNGKLRATISLPRDCDKAAAEAAALADPAVQRTLEGKAPKKVVVVPNRIVNIVV